MEQRRAVHVVTGASGGVGRSIADALLRNGAGVVVIDVAPAEWLGEVAHGTAIVGDAGDSAVLSAAIEWARKLGELHGWVNNAAVFRDAWLHEAGSDAVLDIVDAILRPTVAGDSCDGRRLRARGICTNAVALGSIVTDRYARHLEGLDVASRAAMERQIAHLHPLGRPAGRGIRTEA